MISTCISSRLSQCTPKVAYGVLRLGLKELKSDGSLKSFLGGLKTHGAIKVTKAQSVKFYQRFCRLRTTVTHSRIDLHNDYAQEQDK